MKQADRDLLLQRQVETGERNIELLERQVEAAEDQARASSDLTGILSDRETRERRQQLNTEVEASFPMPHRLFGGQKGAVGLLRSIPGFSGLWEKEVPTEYLEAVLDRAGEQWHLVNCPCNERPLVQAGGLADCTCSRWYFSTGSTVRVKRFPVSCGDE